MCQKTGTRRRPAEPRNPLSIHRPLQSTGQSNSFIEYVYLTSAPYHAFDCLSGPPRMREQAGEGQQSTREHQECRRLRNELQIDDGDTRLIAGHGGRSEAVLRVPDDEGRYELDVARSGRRPLIGALEDEAAEGEPVP